MVINEWINSERVEKFSGLSEFLANTLLEHFRVRRY